MATRHKEFASLCRKVMAMKAKVNERNRQVPEESSVGTVSSPETEADQASEPAKTGSDDDLATAV
jgi:hypothetical protein